MRYDPNKHHRRSIRLQGYDYAQDGAYFVTICTYNRECVLRELIGEAMQINLFGSIVQDSWLDLPNHYFHTELDAFVIMPNHVHGIIVLNAARDLKGGVGLRPTPTLASTSKHHHSLSEIVRAFKSFSTHRINELRDSPGGAVWQRNYYERIIRSEKMLNDARLYIETNPAQWAFDKDNPANFR